MALRSSRRGLLALAALAMMLWLIPGTASAAAVADNQVVDSHSCTTDAFFTLCVDEHSVFHTTLLPDGRSIGNSENRVMATATGVPGGPFEGCVSTGDVNFGGHFTDLGDINLASFGRLRGVATRTCGDPFDFDCTNTFHFRSVDGVIVMDRSTNVCTPV